MKWLNTLLASLTCLALVPAAANAADAKVASLNVYPADVRLVSKKSRQLIVVQAVYADGITRDVSTKATFALANPKLVRREGSKLYPAADGETQLTITYEGQTVVVPVKVEKAAEPRAISFKLDIMPIFLKTGCNTGSCHGAASGKDGFRLSLFGFDPDGDHHRITRELSGRRLDLAVPEASLIVEKALGAVAHTGGTRFKNDTEHFTDMVRWISEDCPKDPADVPTCTSMEIYPRTGVLDGEGETQQVTVRASYSDGSVRDVTSLALFLSSNENSATIDTDGVITAAKRGEAFIMARFATHTVGSQFIVLPKGLQYERPKVEENNYIDQLVHAKLDKLRILPSQRCTDVEFLRRVYLDVIGLPPTVEEYNRFMGSSEADKRAKLIDELLERKEFTEIWVSKWAEWLMIRSSNQVSYKAMLLYYNWLADQIGTNVPMDKMVQNLLSASGGTFKSPATNYYQNETNTLKVSENVAQVFMGMRIQCAQCHNHPFDRWTQNDYYAFAAFFAQVGRKRAEDYRETIIFNGGGGEVRHVVGNRVMAPKFLGGIVPDVKGKDRRAVMVKWLASPENPYFATNFANRVWHHFFGVGIVEPVDDVRVSNPASNPELLNELGKKFTGYKYDFKQLVRDICRSQTYQLSTARNESNMTDELNFAHANLKRIKAESLLDCISQVTQTQNKFRGLPIGARATQIADGGTSTYFLTTFGRATRQTVCSCEVKMEPTLSQALHLLNGDTVNAKIAAGGVLKKLRDQKLEPMQIVEQLYISCLVRKPTPEEVAKLSPHFGEGANVDQALSDVFWALLNSREFLFNH